MKFSQILESFQKHECPYPGLRPFETDEFHLFFGRDKQITELVERLKRNRFVAVVGLSGSGKSSLVRAGLIPALQRGRIWGAGIQWRIVITRPAGAPFEILSKQLLKAGLDPTSLKTSSYGLVQIANQLGKDESLLVVVDQFEELFTYKDEVPANKSAGRKLAGSDFVQLLLAAGQNQPSIYIVLTMRSEYLGDCAEFRGLPEILNECQYLVPRLTREQQREAIEGPVGSESIEPSLIQRLLNDAGDDPKQLPVLQHALMRTWNQWRSDIKNPLKMDLAHYDAIGGFKNALNKHANELLENEVAITYPKIPETIFKRLTSPRESKRETRSPANLAEIYALCQAVTPEQHIHVNQVINLFSKGEATFLVLHAGSDSDSSYLDIAHESLISLWEKLAKEWLPEERKSAKTLQELFEWAKSWKNENGELLAGLDIKNANEWDERRNKTDAWIKHYLEDDSAVTIIMEFIQASRANEMRRIRQARNFRIVIITATVILAFLSGFLYRAEEKASEQEDKAKAAKSQFEVHYARELIEDKGRADQALAYLARTLRHYPSCIAAKSWISTLLLRRSWFFHGPPLKHESSVLFAVFSPNGQRIVTASLDNTARVWDANTGKAACNTLHHKGAVLYATFSADGRVVTASKDNTAQVWNADTGKAVCDPFHHKGAVLFAAFSPDGRFVVTASEDRTAQVWDAKDGKPIGKALQHKGAVLFAAFDPNSKRVATASEDKTAQVWDALSGNPMGIAMRHKDAIKLAVFSPDGHRIVTASADDTAQVWDASTHKPVCGPFNHKGNVLFAVFSPNGQQVVTASEDGTARIWNIDADKSSGADIRHQGEMHSEGFSPKDNLSAEIAPSDNMKEVKRSKTQGHSFRILRHSGAINSAAFSPDGTRIITASADGTAQQWHASSGEPIGETLRHEAPINYAAFNNDGLRSVTASTDGTARVWEERPGKPNGEALTFGRPVRSVVFSNDGRQVLASSWNGMTQEWTTQAWDVNSGKSTGKTLTHHGTISPSKISSNSPRGLTASKDGTALVLNNKTGDSKSGALNLEAPIQSATFSRNGRQVLTATWNKNAQEWTAQMWDVSGGKPIGRTLLHHGMVNSAAISPNGLRVLIAAEDGTAKVWDIISGKQIGRTLLHHSPVVFAAFGPNDSRWVVTACRDNTARVWDTNIGKRIGSDLNHNGAVLFAAISQNGRRLVTASEDKTAKVWDIGSGGIIGKALHHESSVHFAAISADGGRLATTSWNEAAQAWTAQLWEVDSSEHIGEAFQHHSSILYMAFSPDGRRLVTACDDGTVSVRVILVNAESEEKANRLAELAEAIGGYKVNEFGSLDHIQDQRAILRSLDAVNPEAKAKAALPQ
jgi:WD40 repeat protein/energy-coupling factor transporter ATP-binding protein EcfA2